MNPLWTERTDKVADRTGAELPLTVKPYDNLDADPADTNLVGPWQAFGLCATVTHPAGKINVWLICTQLQQEYFTGEGERADKVAVTEQELAGRRKQVMEDLLVKVKLAIRAGQLAPGDEIHVRLGPDVRVPPYGPDWRRALREE